MNSFINSAPSRVDVARHAFEMSQDMLPEAINTGNDKQAIFLINRIKQLADVHNAQQATYAGPYRLRSSQSAPKHADHFNL